MSLTCGRTSRSPAWDGCEEPHRACGTLISGEHGRPAGDLGGLLRCACSVNCAPCGLRCPVQLSPELHGGGRRYRLSPFGGLGSPTMEASVSRVLAGSPPPRPGGGRPSPCLPPRGRTVGRPRARPRSRLSTAGRAVRDGPFTGGCRKHPAALLRRSPPMYGRQRRLCRTHQAFNLTAVLQRTFFDTPFPQAAGRDVTVGAMP